MENSQHVQRSIIWFLWKKKTKAADIHRELVQVCGDAAPCDRTVRKWVALFDQGKNSVEDDARSGRPATAVNPETVMAIENLIGEDPHVTLRELSDQYSLSFGSVQKIVREELHLSKLTARWVPKALTPEMKHNRVVTSRALLDRWAIEGNDLLARIVTGDEKWFSFYEPSTKRNSQEWRPTGSAPPLKPRRDTSAKKRMAIVFWDREGLILTNWVPSGQTVNANYYCKVLTELKDSIKEKRRGKWSRGVLLLHDNARPHTAAQTQATLAQLGFETLPHPPYSPDLAPSDYWLFSEMSKQVRGKKFKELSGMAGILGSWAMNCDPGWFQQGIEMLPKRWELCVKMRGAYVEAAVDPDEESDY